MTDQPGGQPHQPQTTGQGPSPYQNFNQPAPQNPGWEKPPQQRQSATPFIIGGAVLASVLLIGGALFFLLRNNDDIAIAENTVADVKPQAAPTTSPPPKTTTTQPEALSDDELMLTLAESGFAPDASTTDTEVSSPTGGACLENTASVGLQSGSSRVFDTQEPGLGRPFFLEQEILRFDTTENASLHLNTLLETSVCTNATLETDDGTVFSVTSETLPPTQYGNGAIEVSAEAVATTATIEPILYRAFAIQNGDYVYTLGLSSFEEIPREILTQNLELFALKHGL